MSRGGCIEAFPASVPESGAALPKALPVSMLLLSIGAVADGLARAGSAAVGRAKCASSGKPSSSAQPAALMAGAQTAATQRE